MGFFQPVNKFNSFLCGYQKNQLLYREYVQERRRLEYAPLGLLSEEEAQKVISDRISIQVSYNTHSVPVDKGANKVHAQD